MASMKEIREHIASIQSTQKVTNAMYLIASTKMRRAKEDLAKTRPFFDAVSTQIEQIFQHAGEIESPYLYRGNADDLAQPGTYAYLVVTADRGLAGAYNQNVIQETMKRLEKHPDSRLFVVGGNGRHFFSGHGVPVGKELPLRCAEPHAPPRARDHGEAFGSLRPGRDLQALYHLHRPWQRRGHGRAHRAPAAAGG